MALSLEQVKTLAQPWIAPIRADAPAGASSRETPVYQRLVSEVEKLERPTGGTVSWKQVVEDGGEVLKSQSKDLRIASYLAYGLHATQGLNGLLAGISILTEMMETYWTDLFPEATRLRGRANALGWFITRTTNTLSNFNPGAQDRELVGAIAQATARFSEVTRNRFGAEGPALNPLTDCLERIKLSLPPEAPPPSQAAPVATIAAPAIAQPADPTSPEAVIAFAREVGGQLATTAAALRRAKPEEPLSYRLVRTGLWLPIQAVPPADPSGRSKVPAPAPAAREKLEKLAANAKWLELIDEAESLLPQQRLWLDLNRFTAQALAGLGTTHAAARAALIAETRNLLTRLPGLDALVFVDGSASADSATRKWLETEVSAAVTGGRSSAGEAPEEEGLAKKLEEAKGMIRSGRAAEGVALLQQGIQSAGHGEARFQARLALAEACSTAGQIEVARALYAALDSEGRALELDAWNPPLAAKCIQGLLIATRQSKKPRAPLEAELDALYKRLCQIDPAAALRLGAS